MRSGVSFFFIFFSYTIALCQTSFVSARDDRAFLNENTSIEIDVLHNDYGFIQGVSRFEIVTPPQNGVAFVNDINRIIYTPNRSFFGNDKFEYEVCDLFGNCDVATVFLIVNDVDYTPVAVNDTFFINVRESHVFDVLANDIDLFDIPLQLTIIRDFNQGTSFVSNNLLINAQFNSFFVEPDSLLYRVCDLEGDCSEAMVFIVPKLSGDDLNFVPNAFSPNGDGFNDTFTIPELSNRNLSITIFNRNGLIVFHDESYNNNWDGVGNYESYSGKILNTGTYFYLLKSDNVTKQFSGSIFLLR